MPSSDGLGEVFPVEMGSISAIVQNTDEMSAGIEHTVPMAHIQEK